MNKWYTPLILGIVIFFLGYLSSGFSIGISMGLGALTISVVIYVVYKFKKRSNSHNDTD